MTLLKGWLLARGTAVGSHLLMHCIPPEHASPAAADSWQLPHWWGTWLQGEEGQALCQLWVPMLGCRGLASFGGLSWMNSV